MSAQDLADFESSLCDPCVRCKGRWCHTTICSCCKGTGLQRDAEANYRLWLDEIQTMQIVSGAPLKPEWELRSLRAYFECGYLTSQVAQMVFDLDDPIAQPQRPSPPVLSEGRFMRLWLKAHGS